MRAFFVIALLVGCSSSDRAVSGLASRPSSDAGAAIDSRPEETAALPVRDDSATLASCDETWTWSTAEPFAPGASGDSEASVAVSADGATVAWRVERAVLWVDRGADGSYGRHRGIDLPVALDGIALEPDGLGLVFVSSEDGQLREARRGSRDEDFVAFDELPFVSLREQAASAGETIESPALGEGRLVFLRRGGASVSMWEAVREGSRFGAATRLLPPRLTRPTGLSSDGRTLFSWDEDSSLTRVWARATTVDSFREVRTLPARRDARPTADCRRLFFLAGTEPSTWDVAIAEQK